MKQPMPKHIQEMINDFFESEITDDIIIDSELQTKSDFDLKHIIKQSELILMERERNFQTLKNVDVQTAAAIIGIGRNELFAFLRFEKILNKNNIPPRELLTKGLFVVESKLIYYPSGSHTIKYKTLVTTKGLKFLKEKYSEYKK